MKMAEKIFWGLLMMSIFFGCSHFSSEVTKKIVNDQVVEKVVVKKTTYVGSALEVSWSKINDSQSGVNDAVIDGDITAEEGAALLSVQTPMGQRNQSKRVDIDEDTHNWNTSKKEGVENSLSPQQKKAKELYDKF